MAYVFNQLDQAMQPSGTNIFGGGGNAPQQQGQGQQAAPTTGGGDTAVSSGKTGGGGGAPAQQSVGTNQTQAPVDQTAVLQKQGFEAMPSFVSGMQQKESAAAQSQKDEADAYLKGYQNQNFGPDNADVGNVTSDQGAYNRIASFLNQTMAPQAQKFQSAVDLTGTQQDTSTIQDPNKLANYLRSQGGSEYTAGMSGLDQMLLGRSADFQKAKGDILAKEQALEATRAQEEGAQGLQSQAQAGLNTAYQGAQNRVRQGLSDQLAGIQSSLANQVAAENQARQSLAGQKSDLANKAALQSMVSLEQAHPELAQYIATSMAQGGLNAGDYFNVNGPVGVNDVATNDEVYRYNKLQQLLGGGGPALVGGGATTPQTGFDQQKFEAAIMAQALKEKAAEPPPPPPPGQASAPQTLQGDLQKLLGSGGKIAQGENYINSKADAASNYLGINPAYFQTLLKPGNWMNQQIEKAVDWNQAHPGGLVPSAKALSPQGDTGIGEGNGSVDVGGYSIGYAYGGIVGGHPMMPGDHPFNDTQLVPTSPGEGIIPRSNMAALGPKLSTQLTTPGFTKLGQSMQDKTKEKFRAIAAHKKKGLV